MPPKVVIKVNPAAVAQILKSERVQADLARRAAAIAARANESAGIDDGFVVDTEVGPHRARASVVTATAEAMVAEATDRTLTRSIDAGR